MMKEKSYYGVLLSIFVTVCGLFGFSFALSHITNDEDLHIAKLYDFVIGGTVFVVPCIIYYVYEIITLNIRRVNTRQGLFDSVIYPIFEEVAKLVVLIWITKDLTPLDYFWLSLGYSLCGTNVYYYYPGNYDKKYFKFLTFYDPWIHQDYFKTTNPFKNEEEINYIIQNLIPEETTPLLVPTLLAPGKNRTSFCSEDSGMTIVQHRSSIMKLPTEFNLSKQRSCASTPMSSPMRKSISIDTVTANPTLKNYRSCSDFVDKLYSVSPKNTYHLNTATALAAASETFDEYMDSDEEVTTEGRHFGGGGGGNFKLKLPGGTEIEFGGGAGGDYRDGDYDHSDDDDGDDNDNRGGNHRDVNHRGGKQRDDPGNDDNTLQNYSSEDTKFDKTTTSAVSGSQQSQQNYTNLISWLFPPLFTIGEKPTFEGQSYPLIKSRLNSYSLNEECVGLESPISPTITSSSIYRYRNFQYFVLHNFDYCIEQPLSSIVIDPVFKKFGELLKTINVWFIILDEWNYWIWQFSTFFTFGIALSLNSTVSCFMVLFIVTCKMFKVNYLHCLERELDFRMVIFGDTIVNLIIIFINVFVSIAYYI